MQYQQHTLALSTYFIQKGVSQNAITFIPILLISYILCPLMEDFNIVGRQNLYFLRLDAIKIIMMDNLYFLIYESDMTKPDCVVCKLTLSDLFVVNETISRFSKYLFTQVTILSIKTMKRIE